MKKIFKKIISLTIILALSFIVCACENEEDILDEGNMIAQIGESGYAIIIPNNYNVTELKEDDFLNLMISYKYDHSLDIPNISFYRIEGINNFDLKEYINSVCSDVENYAIKDVTINNVKMEKHSFNESYDGTVYYEEEYLFEGIDGNHYIVVFTERDENVLTNTNETYIKTIRKSK